MRLSYIAVIVWYLGAACALRAELWIAGQKVTTTDFAIFDSLTADQTDVLRTEIFLKMVAAGPQEKFNFTDVPQATTHFSTRVEIVGAMNQMNAANGPIRFGMASSGVAYADGWESTNKDYKTISFVRKTNFTSADAIHNIEQGTTNADCITGAKCAILIGFRRSRTDAWINAQLPQPVWVTQHTPGLDGFKFATAAIDTSVAVPGDLMLMTNYDPKEYVRLANNRGNKAPEWGGEACICVGGGKYSGIELISKTEDEMRARLKKAWFDDARVELNDTETAQIQFTWRYRVTIIP